MQDGIGAEEKKRLLDGMKVAFVGRGAEVRTFGLSQETRHKPELAEVPQLFVACRGLLEKVSGCRGEAVHGHSAFDCEQSQGGREAKWFVFNSLKPGQSGRQGEGKDGNRGRELQVILTCRVVSPCDCRALSSTRQEHELINKYHGQDLQDKQAAPHAHALTNMR